MQEHIQQLKKMYTEANDPYRCSALKVAMIILKKQISNSGPSLTDPEDSIQCGSCSSDIPIDEDYQYCPYCGQRL